MNKPFTPGSASQSNNVAPAQSQGPYTRPAAGKQSGFRGSKAGKLLLGLLVLGLLAVGAHYAYSKAASTLIDKNAYQAVFLTNGQVYFGKLQATHADYMTLTDIYYLQVQEAQPAGEAVNDEAANPQTGAADDTQLIKLGEELHAPKDKMTISKDQVLFWEDIKEDGKVVQAIKDYEAKE